MKAIATAASVVALAFALVGCSTAEEPSPPKEEAAAEVTSEPTPTKTPISSPDETSENRALKTKETERGHLAKEIGEEAWLVDINGNTLITFTVDAIDVDPSCTSTYPESPINGHYVAITISAESTALLDPDYYFSFNEWAWEAYNPTGTRINDPVGNGWSCMNESDLLPVDIGPSQKVHGLVVLDVTDPHGVLAFVPEPGLSWEWSY
ncbi:hypothetical protein ACSAGD_03065 [Paramicrobacterium sp. CJ85]|uniref:hypothetical protein n=1 Tax=Paramicrobacterium sp. CJ85 TaxID=3445355 RepID=UPI003F5FD5E9